MNSGCAYSQDIYNRYRFSFPDNIKISFEFFPPYTQEMENCFWRSIEKLSRFQPEFISLTYGAHSGTRDQVFNLVRNIKSRTGLIVAPHVTCFGATFQELEDIARKYWMNGVRHVVALRGDKFGMCVKSVVNHAVDLVSLFKTIGDFDVSVAAYPEVHPEACSLQSDLCNLKKKIDAGANRAITQFFFDVEKYLRFRDLCISSGILVPIVPGILPVFNFRQLQRFSDISCVSIPSWMFNIFNDLDSDLEIRKIIGAIIATEMIKMLVREEVNDFHFYTLNRFELTYAICCMLGLQSRILG